MGNGFKAIPGMVVAATMFNNPLLICSGQELGERGMNAEGFSGFDGRTSIFDYWGLELMQQWRSDGSWSGEMLNNDSQRLRRFYQRLLNELQKNKVLNSGGFYDLMWANKDNGEFNSDHIYAFLRYREGRQCLVIANFLEAEVKFKLQISYDAFEHAGMEGKMFYTGEDILGLNQNIRFSGETALKNGFDVRLEPYSAAIYELSFSVG